MTTTPAEDAHRCGTRRRGFGDWGRLLAAGLVTAPSTMLAQALPFHTETAITTGFEESAVRAFSSFFGRQGLRRNGVGLADPMNRDIDVFVQAFGLLPYAISPMWTTRVVVPFVRKSLAFTAAGSGRRDYVTRGVGDVLVDTKWVFYKHNQLKGTTRVGIEGGIKIPLGSTGARMPDGTRAPRPLQAGTGSWDVPLKALFTMTRDRIGLLANAGYRINTPADGFEAGDVFSYDFAIGVRVAPSVYKTLTEKSLMVYLELNGEVVGREGVAGSPNPNSGGHLLFVSPDLQWIPTPWLLFEGSLQVPVVQDLHGSQLRYQPRLQLGTRFRFSWS